MHIKAKLYPYPILESCFNNGDYIASTFNIITNIKNNHESLELELTPVLVNSGIQKLIDTGIAYFAAHIESSLTSYRKLYKIPKEGIKIVLDASEIEEVLNVCPFIILAEDLIEYTNSDFNEIYRSTRFDIEKGNIIAIGTQCDIYLEKEDDKLDNVESIFSLIESKNTKEKNINVDLSRDKIVIMLPTEEYKEFKKTMGTTASLAVLHSMILVPALMEAVNEMKSKAYDNEYYLLEQKRWFKSIVKAAGKKGIVLDEESITNQNSFYVAQTLLDNTINKGILSIRTIAYVEIGGDN